jgi:hypothetical protein
MKPRNTFTAIAVLMLLGLIASLVTVPSDSGQAWPWNRQLVVIDQDDYAGPIAKRDGIISLTKRTIANVEDITEGIKAGMSAAGKVIDKAETIRGERSEASKTAIGDAVKAAAPLPLPETPAVGQWRLGSDGIQRLTDKAGNQWQYTDAGGVQQVSAAAGCDNCANGQCGVQMYRGGLFGRRGG